ncbi:MAG: MAPEG family protein, partial [Sphingomonadales bacterium]
MLPITLTFAGVAALLNIWLGWRVGQVRMKEKVLTGDGGNQHVICRMRAHANYTEYTPFVLILIAALELSGGWPLALWAVGAAYFLARIAHAFGMDATTPSKARMIGIAVTMVTLLGLAIWALVVSYGPAAHMTR